jgi:chorismate synthase
VPQGIALSEVDFEADLSRRRASAKGTTARHEKDIPTIVTGVVDGLTTGEAIEIVFSNGDTRSSDYSQFEHHPRPSHVDFTARAKYGNDVDLRGSGQFSGRMTVLLVAAGVVAKKIVQTVNYKTSIVEIGGSRNIAEFQSIIEAAMRDGDSVGGVVECRAKGIEVGVGEPFFDSVESVIAHLMFSVPAVKGVEFGSGFEGVRLRGSERNDCFVDGEGHTATNNEGGINGGITNGNELVVRVAIKPTPSISCPQMTYNKTLGEVAPLQIKGRHDACIALRAAVVVESVVAIALAELSL